MTAVPEVAEEPPKVGVLLLFAEKTNQNIQVVKANLSQFDLQVHDDTRGHRWDSGRGGSAPDSEQERHYLPTLLVLSRPPT